MKKFSQWMEENYGQGASPRDEKWLAQERARLMTWPLENLISWLRWADPNGSYSDEDAAAEDMDPLDIEGAVELVMQHVEENLETPEEMRAASARQAHRQPATPLAWDAKGLMSRSR
jgi:hypothetical protein